MTRADMIRNMSNDELANFLCELVAPTGCTGCRFDGHSPDNVYEWCGAMHYLLEEVNADADV